MKTDLYLLSGFLGSGKTSTLRHVLSNMPDPAGTLAVVNEAGALGLDSRLVEKAGIPVHELRNGCICCSMQVDFIALLDRLFHEPDPPRRVLMESSGLADPVKLIKTAARFDEFLGFRKMVLLLDAAVWEIREAMGDLFSSQLRCADLLLLNKIDLFEPGQILKFIEEIKADFPGVNLVPTIGGQVDPEMFFSPPINSRAPIFGLDQTSLSNYDIFSFQSLKPIERQAWEKFIRERGGRYERIKGQLLLTDGPVYFDYVRGRADRLPPLPDIEGSLLTFIGLDFDKAELSSMLESLCVG